MTDNNTSMRIGASLQKYFYIFISLLVLGVGCTSVQQSKKIIASELILTDEEGNENLKITSDMFIMKQPGGGGFNCNSCRRAEFNDNADR